MQHIEFLGGAIGGQNITINSQWMRHFVVTNKSSAALGAPYLFDIELLVAGDVFIDDIHFIPVDDFLDVPAVIDGYNYVPTYGTRQLTPISRDYVYQKSSILNGINLRKMTATPAAPEEGDVYFADGTSWDPGSGKGLYLYNGTAYEKL